MRTRIFLSICLLITSLACNLGTLIDIKYDDPAILSAEKILGTQEAIAEEIFYEQLTATAYALDDLKALATEIASSVGNQDSDDSIQEDDCAGLTLEECIVLGTYTYTQYYEEFGHCRGDENRSGPREDADFTIGFIDGDLVLFSEAFGWDLTYEPVQTNVYAIDTYTDGTPDLRITLTLTGQGFITESRKIADDSSCLLWTRILIN